MERHQVISDVADLLARHVGTQQDALSTEPSRRHIFRLFKEAYPELSADALGEAVIEEWLTRQGRIDEAQYESLAHLTLAWSEWTYAWEKYEIRLAHIGR